MFLVGQWGKSADRKRALSLLLSVEDLPPPGWQQLAQRSWRIGVGVRSDGPDVRARKAGAFWGRRSFKQALPARGFFCQLGIFSSSEDAKEVVNVHGRRPPTLTWRGVTLLKRVEVEGLSVPECNSHVVFEHETLRGEVHGYQRIISASVNSVVFAVAGSAVGPGFAWEDLVAIAAGQARKIREGEFNR